MRRTPMKMGKLRSMTPLDLIAELQKRRVRPVVKNGAVKRVARKRRSHPN